MANGYRVIVRRKAGGEDHQSPLFGSEDEAKLALDAIRDAQKNDTHVELA
jgi:hypothetical protein